ncbi:LysR substrate-binding domain-containing protein [Cupriavidus basilensis]
MLTKLAAAIHAFAQERPGVEVVVHELNSFEQIEALQRGLIDIGIAHPRVIPAGLASRVLYAERFICVLPSDHPLAAQAQVDLRQLRLEDFVLFPRHFAPEYYDKIVALCMGARSFTPSIRHGEVRHMLTIATLVSQNFGVSLVPASVALVQCAQPGLPGHWQGRAGASRTAWRLARGRAGAGRAGIACRAGGGWKRGDAGLGQPPSGYSPRLRQMPARG